MTPLQLQPESFRGYPVEARALAERHVALLRTLPLSFVTLLLREVIAYDRKFPAERRELEHQLQYLASLPKAEREQELQPFRSIRIEGELTQLNWVDQPARFSEALSAHLWSTHQIDAFHAAAVAYMDRATASLPAPVLKKPRLAVAIVGQGVRSPTSEPFRRLRPHGAYFTNVDPGGGLTAIESWLRTRAAEVEDRYAHWWISGALPPVDTESGVTTVSYDALAQPRAAMSAFLRRSFEAGTDSETLRTRLAAMQPADLGLDASADPAASWFQLSLLSEGSGTQIFSTSFVQWAAREALRRAQPLTLICRFTPRVRSSSMKDLLNPASAQSPVLDAEGSLVDAEMAAYQTWLNFERLPGAKGSVFLCWFEGRGKMLAIAPGLKAGTTQERAMTFEKMSREFGLT